MQEFMILPVGAANFHEAMRIGAEVSTRACTSDSVAAAWKDEPVCLLRFTTT